MSTMSSLSTVRSPINPCLDGVKRTKSYTTTVFVLLLIVAILLVVALLYNTFSPIDPKDIPAVARKRMMLQIMVISATVLSVLAVVLSGFNITSLGTYLSSCR